MPKRVEIEMTPDEDASLKKRKRIQSASSSSSKVGLTSPTSIKTDPYETVITFEEREASSRSSEEDLKLFHETCNAIRKIMSQIEGLKKHPERSRSQISELRALAGLHVLSLKKINRLEKVRLKSARDSTHAAKQRVDAFHLTLQNLLYEIVHVRREVHRCLEFRSRDEDISLVSEEDFYRDAPEEISRPEVTRVDPHRRQLARLDWELEQRRRLAESCRQLDSDKSTIAEKIGQQRRRLNELAPQLTAVLQSTRPLQESLSLPLEQRRQQHRLAALLPRPLYVLYVQTAAYAEACDPEMSATIAGDEEEALSLKQADQRDTGDDSESDQEQEEEENRKKRHRRTGRVEEDQRVKQLLRRHPLQVLVEVNTKDAGRLLLEFSHVTELGIVTVNVTVQDCPARGALVSPDSVLDHLWEGDTGTEAPSAAVEFRLRRAGLPTVPRHVATGQLGRPYLWAQRLAGLEFADSSAQEVPAPRPGYSALHVEAAVREMRARLRARVALQAQLTALAGGELAVPAALQPQFPPRRDTRLVSWTAISAETFRSSGVLPADMVPDGGTCFLARLGRVPGLQMSCYLAVSPRHPKVAPLCGLVVNHAGKQLTAHSPRVRAVEHEVNVSLPARLSAAHQAAVLPAQLLTAADALDLLAETADGAAAPGRNHLLLRKHRGRDRVPPLRYESSTQLFSHAP